MAVNADFYPRDDEDLTHLARCWIAFQLAANDSEEYKALFWAWERMRYLTEYLPQKTWLTILLIWSLDPSDKIAEDLARGLVWDLLHHFGPEIAPLGEAELRRDPTFARALGEDWQLSVDDTVWLKDVDPRLRPGDKEDMEHFVRCWIASARSVRGTDEYNSLFWTRDRTAYLTTYLPHTAWRAILLIWSLDQSPEVQGLLAAGFVEDMLSNHGSEMIELVEAEARRDPSFARMLGGVWKFQMTDDVWERLQKVWDRRGWDGIPEE